jgi:hypothetical protein
VSTKRLYSLPVFSRLGGIAFVANEMLYHSYLFVDFFALDSRQIAEMQRAERKKNHKNLSQGSGAWNSRKIQSRWQ